MFGQSLLVSTFIAILVLITYGLIDSSHEDYKKDEYPKLFCIIILISTLTIFMIFNETVKSTPASTYISSSIGSKPPF
tara:strand:+ start:165 stop:398 length:234 start_codon:yes stop_codon:yes gene_type:complete